MNILAGSSNLRCICSFTRILAQSNIENSLISFKLDRRIRRVHSNLGSLIHCFFDLNILGLLNLFLPNLYQFNQNQKLEVPTLLLTSHLLIEVLWFLNFFVSDQRLDRHILPFVLFFSPVITIKVHGYFGARDSIEASQCHEHWH